MALFGLFGSKPKKTPLVEMCEKLTLEKATKGLPAEPTPKDLTIAYAIMLLHLSHKFWLDLSEIKGLKDYCAKTSPNVIIFETLVFSWSVITAIVERWAEDELFLDGDDEYLQALASGLHVALGVMEKQWPELNSEDYLKRRLYPLHVDKCIEKFVGHLYGSEGRLVPTNTPNAAQNLKQIVLIPALVMSFATTVLSGVADGLQAILGHIVEQQQ